MNRREFLTNVGLGGFLALSTQKAVSKEQSEELPEDILQQLNQVNYCTGNFVLTAQYDPVHTVNTNNSLIRTCPEFKRNVEVALKPGPDGNLYLQYNGQWKKILTN
jgi:hypothetical protein